MGCQQRTELPLKSGRYTGEGDIVGELDAASSELRAKLAEPFDRYVMVHSGNSSKDWGDW